ncbi:MAG: ATP-binding protein [Dehalococcoidales bacterium]|nr:ATP-binding protein [Dehalococcoidales bacterium]
MVMGLDFPQNEFMRRADSIGIIAIGAFISQLISQIVVIILWLFNSEFPVISFTAVAVSAIFISLISYWLVKINKVKIAGYFLTIGYIIYTAIVTPIFWGFTGPLPIIYFFPIIIAGMVIKLKAGFLTATLATLVYLIMILVEQTGIIPQVITIPEPEPIISHVTVAVRIIFFYLVAFLSWFAAYNLNKAMQRVQLNAQELRIANEELQISEEKLRASNEELQVIEEEIRATNEELQVSNEELRETQDQLIRSEKLAAIGQLAGGVGHELRNPLGAIKNAIYYVKRKITGSELSQKEPKLIEFLDIVDSEINSSNKIINDLLGFSRVGKPAVSPSKINRVIEDALSHLVIPENIEVIKKLNVDLPIIDIDTEQIQQVLVNIIMNALQAMPEKGNLTISSGKNSKFLEVEISDTGCGIPEEAAGKIFDPLYTMKAKGIGLGLAVCKSIIDRHQGYIEVESQVGKGTTFTIKLPLQGQ